MLVDRVPEGWTRVAYAGRAWGLSRTTRAGGAGVAVYAEALGGTDVVSTNVYRTRSGDVLRPCEMPAAEVLDFLRGWVPLGQDAAHHDPTDQEPPDEGPEEDPSDEHPTDEAGRDREA